MRKRHDSKRFKKKNNVEDSLLKVESILTNVFGNESIIKEKIKDILNDTPFFNLDVCHDILLDDNNNNQLERNLINWDEIPFELDPAAGEIEKGSIRARRKREQVSSLIYPIEDEILMLNNQLINSNINLIKEEEINVVENNDNLDDIELQDMLELKRIRNNGRYKVIDVGAGSGHLGLLVAYRNPNVDVILCERKEYSVRCARDRIKKSGLNNVVVFCGDIRDIPIHLGASVDGKINENNLIGVGIGLHCCGLLTDLALRLCCTYKLSFCISPCCYGQVTKPPPPNAGEDNQNKSLLIEVAAEIHRSQQIFQLVDQDVLANIASGSDHCVNFEDEAISNQFIEESIYLSNQLQISNKNNTNNKFKKSSNIDDFILAKRCMRYIDLDRLVRVCEDTRDDVGGYLCKMASLNPLSCSPKNNIIIGRYLR